MILTNFHSTAKHFLQFIFIINSVEQLSAPMPLDCRLNLWYRPGNLSLHRPSPSCSAPSSSSVCAGSSWSSRWAISWNFGDERLDFSLNHFYSADRLQRARPPEEIQVHLGRRLCFHNSLCQCNVFNFVAFWWTRISFWNWCVEHVRWCYEKAGGW